MQHDATCLFPVSDWETLNWAKMAALIDNSTEFTYGMGLVPWYLPGYILPAGKLKAAILPHTMHVHAWHCKWHAALYMCTCCRQYSALYMRICCRHAKECMHVSYVSLHRTKTWCQSTAMQSLCLCFRSLMSRR